ncbi:MAG: S1C family serine protease [Chloroflexota bacterium]
MKRQSVFIIVLLLAAGLAACDTAPDTPAPTARPSTPAADLPLGDPARAVGPPTPLPDEIIREADAEYLLMTNIFERAAPSVVNIEIVIESPGFREVGRGSGFVYDRNGRIITNAHVIDGADEIYVTFNDGFVTDADIIGQDNYSDIAVIRVDVPPQRLLPLELADSDDVRVGERAIAIGNPWGLHSSMTSGIISAVGRQINSAELIDVSSMPGFQNPRIIQVDADINPGNSGGPLLNSRGEVIGVNTAIRSESGAFQGVGFSVPSNTVSRVVPELIANGEVNYAWIGISTFQSQFGVASLADSLDLPVDSGVLVTHVMPESPAAEADVRGGKSVITVRDIPICAGGDIIVAVDGTYVQNMDELVYYLLINTIPGDVVELLVVREDGTFEIPVTLGERPASGTLDPTCGD